MHLITAGIGSTVDDLDRDLSVFYYVDRDLSSLNDLDRDVFVLGDLDRDLSVLGDVSVLDDLARDAYRVMTTYVIFFFAVLFAQ